MSSKSAFPCCCISSTAACLLIGAVDMLLGIVIVIWSFVCAVSYDRRYPYRSVGVEEMPSDVAWFGITSFFIVGLTCIFSGLELFATVDDGDKSGRLHIFKCCLFLSLEVIGFVAPFYIIEDYAVKIHILTSSNNPSCWLFHLLDVNPITFGCFVYQIFSFWLVHRHTKQQKALALSKLKLRKTANHLQVVPKVPITTAAAAVPSQGDFVTIQMHAEGSAHSGGQTQNAPGLSKKRARSTNSGLPSKFQSLKQKHLAQQTLFVDEEFPANGSSLGIGSRESKRVEWKRPHEIVDNPQFFTDGATRFDVKQGELGDCWFLAAVANLTLNQQLLDRVVPADNVWAEDEYCGIFHFKFWGCGEWKEVIVDDRLPTVNGQLIFLRSAHPNEFWSPLLEKAYGKLFNGSYQSLNGGDGIGRAMIHLTGGRVEKYRLEPYKMSPENLFRIMANALNNGSMLGAVIHKINRKHEKATGLLGEHAYSITDVQKVNMTNGHQVSLVRTRNPWGNGTEWKGDWRDGHPSWDLVDKKTRLQLKLIFKNDGEFWFPLEEFANHFHVLEICHLPK